APHRPRLHWKNLKRSTTPTHIKIGAAKIRIATTTQTVKKVRWNARPFFAHSGQIAVPRTQVTSPSLTMTQPQELHLIGASPRTRGHDPLLHPYKLPWRPNATVPPPGRLRGQQTTRSRQAGPVGCNGCVRCGRPPHRSRPGSRTRSWRRPAVERHSRN